MEFGESHVRCKLSTGDVFAGGSNRFSYSDRSDGRWTHWHFEGFSRRFARETPTQGRQIHWNFQWKKNAGTKPAILSMFERKCGR